MGGGAFIVPGGHPYRSPYHNGSAVDVAVIVEAFSQLGTVVFAVLFVAIPLYLALMEAYAVRHGRRPGSFLLATLQEVVSFASLTAVTGPALVDGPNEDLMDAVALEEHRARWRRFGEARRSSSSRRRPPPAP